MTSLGHGRSPFIVPTFLFRFHSNGLAYFGKQHRYGDNTGPVSNDEGSVSNEERWEFRFNELKEYKKEHGDTLVPQRYAINPQLGFWVDKQRQQYKRNQLSAERIHRLNEVAFVWNILEAAWEETFVELTKYKKQNGDTLVPQSYSINPQLGIWVHNQRQRYKSKQLSDERIRRLNEIGFVWDPFEEFWEEMCMELKEYKKQNGDTLVSCRYEVNPQLGSWVSKQRTKYKSKQLSDERIQRLNKIGFVWEANELAWEKMFAELKKYKKQNGDTLVPQRYKDNPQLGIWVVWQRQHYKRNQLSDERIHRLNELGFVWDPYGQFWEEMFMELNKYKEQNGDTLVPYNYEDNSKLGWWVSNQRTHYKLKQSGKVLWLTDERVARLNEIDFIWDPHGEAWQSNYNKLCSFYKEHGNTKIPCQDEEHKQLYRWCMRQRDSEVKGKLNDDRRDLLQKINFDFFRRKVTKGSSLLENMIIYELEEIGHVFDMTNEVFFTLKIRYRPDGVIFVDNSTIIFVEVDEKFHTCSSRYPVERELSRMIALKTEAERKGYKLVTFVRIGTGNQREPNYNQLTFVSNHLHELKRTAPWKTSRVHYIDYPSDHHHIIASKAEEGFVDKVVEFSSGIW
jgi:hypothetical protein